MTDRAGQTVRNEQDWHRSRNQQRNWETLIQLLSLRTQPMQLIDPRAVTLDHVDQQGLGSHYRGPQQVWLFDFAVESDMIFHSGDDATALLKSDSEQVPMILGIGETAQDMPNYITQDPIYRNVWFGSLDGK